MQRDAEYPLDDNTMRETNGISSRSSSEHTLVDQRDSPTIKLGATLPWDGRRAGCPAPRTIPSRKGLAWASGFVLANCLTTAIISQLSYKNSSRSSLLLPAIGYGSIALITRIPQWLPNEQKKPALEHLHWLSGHDPSSVTLRYALLAAAAASLSSTLFCIASRSTSGLLIQSLSVSLLLVIMEVRPNI